MKIKLATIFALLCLALACSWAVTVKTYSVTPHATTLATSTTDSTAGDAVTFDGPVDRVTVYVTAKGVAGTTNGSFVATILFSPDNSTWETSAVSSKTVTISTLGATTQTASAWFMVPGARYVKVGQIANTFGGAVSNIAVNVTTMEY